jgi:hypothetical protein
MGSADLIETQNWAGENLRLNFFAKIFQEKFGGQWTAEAVATSRVSDFWNTRPCAFCTSDSYFYKIET